MKSDNVYQRLNAARAKFHESPLKKSGTNKFAGYSYFELSDFVVPALRIFHECGLTSVITFRADSASMDIINVEKPEERITFTSPMSEANLKGCHPVQNLGAVETYVRRYLWIAALEIVEHDALDATVRESEKLGEQGEPPASTEQLQQLQAAADDAGADMKKLMAWLKLGSPSEMNATQWRTAMDAIKLKKRRTANA